MHKTDRAENTQTIRPVFVLFLLTAVGLGLNLLGSQTILALKIPLFIDCLGTILASALGGYIPGVAVGFFTNLINGISDPTTAYYSSINVIIAICAAFFAKRGFFRKLSGVLTSVLTFALIGGGLGSVLTWLLFGKGFGEGISEPLARSIYKSSHLSVFISQLSADMLIDIADKVITMLLVILVLRLIPQSLKDRLYLYGWQQAPLGKKDRVAAQGKLSRRASLQTKITLLLASAILLIAVVVTSISLILYRSAMIEQETRMGSGVAHVAAGIIDPNRVDEFIEEGEDAPGYQEVEAHLAELTSSSPDIVYTYAYRIDPEGCRVVFDIDTVDMSGSEPGSLIPFDDSFTPYLPDLLLGQPIDPIITNDTYGWLLTIYEPVYDENGVCRCYAGIDISMEHLQEKQIIFLARVISLFVAFFLIVLVVGVWLAEYGLILPINSMALATGVFAYNSEDARDESIERISELDIHTGDEIENLYRSIEKTTRDTAHYIEESQKQAEQISNLQNGLILVLADLVESRDKCTGDHVRNTAAYAKIVMEQMKRDGIYTEQLTDEFMNDVVNSAPLHDVGKISVSDALLNKPGKLTESEFEQMKTHAMKGGEIISQAIATVSEDSSGYLKEARNLAIYHHEKWDGSGYPSGLSGEDIPLSARIMAVADVFDALVSKRSYKEGFSFEKSMSIIEEGSGSHFDPHIAGAFLRAAQEVRKVAGHKGS